MSLTSANRSIQLLIRMLDSKNSTEPMQDFGVLKPDIPLGRSTHPLPRVVPESCGIPSRHLAAFLMALKNDHTLHMHSILVVRNGRVLCEAAFGAQDLSLPRMTFSACKSVVALAIGLLMDDGLLHPDDRLTDLFFGDCGPVSRTFMKDLTLQHLLTMQTGNNFNEVCSMTEREWAKHFCASPSLTNPIGKFQYNSLNTYMLAVLVHRLTGKTVTELLDERLFTPMGIADYYWETSPEGIEKGGWGLYMRAEDLAKLGQLVMDGGCWNGQQLLSASFLKQATTAQIEAPGKYGDFNYGWQIWVGKHDNTFLFNGLFGQNVLCFRDSGIIIVSHAGNAETFQQSHYFPIVQKYLGGTFPMALPRDRLAERELKKVIQVLADCTGTVPTKAQFSVFADKRLVADDPKAPAAGLLPLVLQATENCYSKGLQAITIAGTRTQPELFYEERDQLLHLYLGTKEPHYQDLIYHGNVFRVAAQARFTHDEDDNPVLCIRIDCLETPCTRSLKLIRLPGGWKLRQDENPHIAYLLDGAADAAPNAASRAIVSTILGSSESDYLYWKLDQIFSPTLKFREEG